LVVALAFAPAAVAAPVSVLGPDAAACGARSRGAAILVAVEGLRARTGSIRISLYANDEAAFLARGRSLRRVDVPVSGAGPMSVCIAAPGPGRYAVAVRHDENGNGRTDLADGGGFSRNPPLSLLSRPRLQDVAIDVARGVTRTQVRIVYAGAR
jgi:uncharacterized protein (DUF2141 family)